MKRLLILLIFAVTHLSLEVRAADEHDGIPVLKVNTDSTTSKILLRDALKDVLDTCHLYGDNVDQVQYGGATDTRFNNNWAQGKKLKLERNSNKEILLIIPPRLEVGYTETLKAVKAYYKNEKDGWCPDTNTIEFKVEIVKLDESLGEQEEASKSDSQIENSSDRSEENNSKYFPLIAFGLSILNLILVFLLFKRISKLETPSQFNQNNYQKEIVELKNEVHNLRNLLAKKSLTEDDVKRIITNTFPQAKSITSPVSKPVSPRLVQTPRPVSTPKSVDTMETIDTLEYSFQENKFVITGESQQIFVINRKGDDYSFTLKDARVCQEIMPMLNAYSKCISVMGNTSSANSIGSITPGVINPTGDGLTFSVASPIVINFI